MKRFLKRVSLSSIGSRSTLSSAIAIPTTPFQSNEVLPKTEEPVPSGLEWNQEGYLLRHLGSKVLDVPYTDEILETSVCSFQKEESGRSFHLQLANGTLTVTDLTGQVLIKEDVTSLVSCIQDTSQKVQDCLGIVLPAEPTQHHLHIFQAMSYREAGVIVQHLSYALGQKRPLKPSSSSGSGSGSSDKGTRKQQVGKIEEDPKSLPARNSQSPIRTYGQSSSQQLVGDKAVRIPVAVPSKGAIPSPVASKTRATRKTFSDLSPFQKRRVSMRRVGSIGKATALSLGQCIERVRLGRERIREYGKALVFKCKSVVPSSQLNIALKAIFENNVEGLAKLLSTAGLSIECADSSGNTLLHYAVACQRSDIVKLLCERGAAVDKKSDNAITPLHQAAAEGTITIMRLLLERGASPNDLDSHLRSPLHFTAGIDNSLECTYALLERGARIYQKDALDVSPVDLNKALRNMQIELVKSVCESFSSTQMKDYEVDLSDDSIGGSLSSPFDASSGSLLFPMGSRDRSLSSESSSHEQANPTSPSPHIPHSAQPKLAWQPQYGSHLSLSQAKYGSLRRFGSSESLASRKSDELLQVVKLANARAARFKEKISQMRQSELRRSTSQLFLEAEEDEMRTELRKEKLKFPSDSSINVAGIGIEMNAEAIEKELNDLLQFGLRIGKSRPVRRAQPVLTEAEFRFDTKKHTSPTENLSSNLELHQSHGNLSAVSTLEGSASQKDVRVLDKISGSHTSSETLVNKQGSSESDSVITHYTTSTVAMQQAFTDLQKAVEHDKYHERIRAVAEGRSEEDIPRISIAKRPLHKKLKYHSSSSEHHRRQETDTVFEAILADLQGDLPNETESKVRATSSTKTQPSPAQEDLPTKEPPVVKRTLGPAISLEPVTMTTVRQRSASALVASNHDYKDISGSTAGSHQRSRSFTSSVSSAGLLNPSHHRRSWSQPFSMAPNEPGAASLKGLIMLSSNEECLSKLIQYICIPKFSTNLIMMARSPRSSYGMLANVASLMQNIYEVGGSAGRKRAVESGILTLTVKLLRAREPIPGTMLQLLYSLLFSEEDPNSYLRAIARIPISPLLAFLDSTDKDSGIDPRQRNISVSTPPSGNSVSNQSRESTGAQVHSEFKDFEKRSNYVETLSPRGNSDGPPRPRGGSQTSDQQAKLTRPSSREGTSTSGIETYSDGFHSDTDRRHTDSGSSRSLTTPTLHGQTMTFTEAKRIALKLFAALSVYDKLHRELDNARAIALLVDSLQDVSQENVTNAVMTLANVARNTATHSLMKQRSAVEKLRPLLQGGPTIRHHACRALVYLGEMETDGVSLFQRGNGYGNEEVLYMTSESTELDKQLWGASIEHLVHYLIEDPAVLWSVEKGISKVGVAHELHTPSERKITEFFLVMMKSYVDPLIFLRLLLHRLVSHDLSGYIHRVFVGNNEEVSRSSSSPSLSRTGDRVLDIIEQWMDRHQDDFLAQPLLQKEVSTLYCQLRDIRGPYLAHAQRLKSLLDTLGRPRAASSVSVNTERLPHHDQFYPLCQKTIVEGHLPITGEQAVVMAALQVHIESYELRDFAKQKESGRGKKHFQQQIKRSLPSVYQKTKNVCKRVQEQLGKFSKLSIRNAKHLYIEKCQALPGYGCQFFSVTLKSPTGSLFRKGQTESRLLGIGDKEMILLDGRTKQVLSQFNVKDIVKYDGDREKCLVTVKLKGRQFTFITEDQSAADGILRILEQFEEEYNWQQLSGDDLEQFDQSLEHLDHSNTTRPAATRQYSGHRMAVEHVLLTAAVGLDQSHNMSADNHMTAFPVGVDVGSVPTLFSPWNPSYMHEEEDDDDSYVIKFICDCPPDPELGHLQLSDIQLPELLEYPLEVARQITLIDHELLSRVTATDLLWKIGMASHYRATGEPHASSQSITSSSLSTLEQAEGTIEKLAFRFNLLGDWVASSILQYNTPEERAEVVMKFIVVAKHCFELRNYSAVRAIIVAGLQSPSIRRLKSTWQIVPVKHQDFLKKMDNLFVSKNNYKKYRDMLANTTLPSIPYFGVFMKDLKQIVEYNPGYLKGGLVNLKKRRQIYEKVEEIAVFQRHRYNYRCVPEIRDYLLHTTINCKTEEALHEISHLLEPKEDRSGSQISLRSTRAGSMSSLTNIPSGIMRIFRHGSTESIT